MRRLLISLTIVLITILTWAAPNSTCAQDANVDSWFGTLDFGAIKLRLRVDVTEGEDGKQSAVVVSLDQGNARLECDEFSMDDGQLKFKVNKVNASFEGKIASEGVAEGTFTQMGQAVPLKLKMGDGKEYEQKRPQMPKQPFPYESIEVQFNNESDKSVTLAGTLTMPKGEGPFPAVLLVTGSGPQDRDESVMGHKPFLVLADYLTRQGIAVLRYDDRGINKSTGSFATSTSVDFAGDAASGLAYLAKRDKIDSARIGLVGHSEGGLIGTMLAAKDNNQLAHVVLLAGPGVKGDEIIRSQAIAIAKASGLPTDSDDTKLREQALDALKTGASDEELMAIAEKFLENAKITNSESDEESDASDEITKTALRAAMTQLTTPWFRYFVTYDPAVDLAKANCPVLAMIGSNDLQVLAELNLPAIQKALASAPAQGHQVERLEGLNHLFQTTDNGSPAEYGQIEETMSPKALEMIASWIREH